MDHLTDWAEEALHRAAQTLRDAGVPQEAIDAAALTVDEQRRTVTNGETIEISGPALIKLEATYPRRDIAFDHNEIAVGPRFPVMPDLAAEHRERVPTASVVLSYAGLRAPVLYQHCEHCPVDRATDVSQHTMRCHADGCRQGLRKVGKIFLERDTADRPNAWTAHYPDGSYKRWWARELGTLIDDVIRDWAEEC